MKNKKLLKKQISKLKVGERAEVIIDKTPKFANYGTVQVHYTGIVERTHNGTGYLVLRAGAGNLNWCDIAHPSGEPVNGLLSVVPIDRKSSRHKKHTEPCSFCHQLTRAKKNICQKCIDLMDGTDENE